MSSNADRLISSVEKRYPHKYRAILYKHAYRVPLGPKEIIKKLNPITKIKNHRAEQRAKTTIKDIALCNYFDLFVTLTFATDRQNIDLCKMRTMSWLRRQTNKYGPFNYLIVPEFHKDGVSIHFHAFFGGYKGKLVDSGKKINGRKAYNLTEWRLGFSTAVPITQQTEDREKVANYLTKYITKDMPTFAGKKRYWVSQKLQRPEKTNNEFYRHPRYIVRHNYILYDTEYFTIFEIPVEPPVQPQQ
jgi:hypothetical protein